MYAGRLTALAALSLTGAALLVGCGSSKPAYCTEVANFDSSVEALKEVGVSPSNASGLTAALQKVSLSATELKSALKIEFAPQTSAVKNALSAIESSAKQVASATTSSAKVQAAAAIPGEVERLGKAASEVQEVTKSKCK
jgi:hypothetical protein